MSLEQNIVIVITANGSADSIDGGVEDVVSVTGHEATDSGQSIWGPSGISNWETPDQVQSEIPRSLPIGSGR